MTKPIDAVSSERSSFLRKGARALCEEGDFYGATRVARFTVIVACTALACSPEPQTGTNTNWACRVDTDCAEHEGTTCQDGFCAKSAGQPDAAGGPSPASSGAPVIGSLGAVVVTDAGFIATGYRILTTFPNASLVVTSSNGRDWAATDAAGEGFGPTVFGNETLVASSRVSDKAGFMAKPPGQTWQFHQAGSDIGTLLFGNGVFFAPFQKGVSSLVSTDGVDWSPASSIDTEWYGFQDGQFLGWLSDESGTWMRTSTDGVTWSDPKPLPATRGPTLNRQPLARAGDETIGLGYWICEGDFCAVPAMVVWPNGIDAWAPAAVKAPWASNPQFIPAAITASDERVVVAARKDDSTTSQIWTTTLPRGSDPWQSADIPPEWQVFDLAYGAGVFVVVGQQLKGHWLPVLATSTDGLNWREVAIAQ